MKFAFLIFSFSFFLFSCSTAEKSTSINEEDNAGATIFETQDNTDGYIFIVHEGRYRGDNIYIQNPFAGDGEGFCVIKVEVNGDVTDCSITTSAFEIDLSTLNLQFEDPIIIKITHKTDCQPKFLNPMNNGFKRSVSFSTIKINENMLFWEAENVKSDSCFYIEQYRWNRWLKVTQVDTSETQIAIVDFLHSGTNKFRLIQYGKSGYPTISNSTSFTSSIEEITFDKKYNDNNQIDFSSITPFQLYNTEGKMVLEGEAKEIDLSQLPNGTYYLNFDNTTGEIIKLKR